MKHKEQIIGIVVLVVVFAIMGAVWQFHFKEIFQGYQEDDKLRETLEKAHSQLEEAFQGYKPELLINEWQNHLQPWRMAREERSAYFNLGDWYDVEFEPDEERMLKFWYNDELDKMLRELYTKVYERMGGYDRFPQNIRAIMNVQSSEEWGNRDPSPEEVKVNLKHISFAQSLTEFLLDANVSSVSAISMWPRRIPQKFMELLGLQTVGVQCTMTTKDLVKMLDKYRQELRYFNFDAIKITYPYIAYNVEPQVNVRFLVTQALYRKPADETQGAVGARAAASRTPARTSVKTVEEPGMFSKGWTWFKRNVLYMN